LSRLVKSGRVEAVLMQQRILPRTLEERTKSPSRGRANMFGGIRRKAAHPDPTFLDSLYETRSVQATAQALGLTIRDAMRSAMLAFGLGKLDYRLQDF
jgi:hypothetical protein